MKQKSKWTKDEREFDRIMNLIESRGQLDRIRGRSEWRQFEQRFTPEQLEEMAKSIGARRR